MMVGTIVGLSAVAVVGGGALLRAVSPARAVAARHDLGVRISTVRGRLWVALNPPVRVDLFERGLVLTPSFLPRVPIKLEEIDAVLRVKDARESGRRRKPGTRIEYRGAHKIALELDGSSHQTLVDWWKGR